MENDNKYEFITICPFCNEIPEIKINENLNEVEYKCSKKSNSIPIQYLININNKLIEGKKINNLSNICNSHGKEYIKYCINCNLNFCEKCKSTIEHNKHETINIKSICPTGSKINKTKLILEKAKKNLEKSNNYFNEYINSIKNQWEKYYRNQLNLIIIKEGIISTYIKYGINFNAIINLNEIENSKKFISKSFDIYKEIILNSKSKEILNKINDLFSIKKYTSIKINDAILSLEAYKDYNNKDYIIAYNSNKSINLYSCWPKFELLKNIELDNNINNIKHAYNMEEKTYFLINDNNLKLLEIYNDFNNFNYIKIGDSNCNYDYSEYIKINNNEYIISLSRWLSFLYILKRNNESNLFELINNFDCKNEDIISFIINSDFNEINIISANSISLEKNENNLYLKFINFTIINNSIKSIKKVDMPNFLNDQNCLKKFNNIYAILILGKFIENNYAKINANISYKNKDINGLAIININTKQTTIIIEYKYIINQIYLIENGIFIYTRYNNLLSLVKYNSIENITFENLKLIFDLNINEINYIGKMQENKLILDNNEYFEDNEEEYIINNIFVFELKGGLLLLCKDNNINIYK